MDDFLNRITHGNCLDVLDQLPDVCLDAVLIDPPYGEDMGYDGDDNPLLAEELLSAFLRKAESKIKRNAHLAIFWTMRNLDLAIDAVRSCGFLYRRTLSMYLPKGNARPYLGWLPRTQAIVIAQKYLPKRPIEFHRDLAEYLSNALSSSGLTKAALAKQLRCDSRLVMKWTRVGDPAWCLPTPRFYRPLKEILKLNDDFDVLLERGQANPPGDFDYRHDTYLVDDKNERMLHPSQKPLSVVEHLVTCLCPPGGVILDGFAGSATTAVACQKQGRNFIAVEMSGEYCDIGRQRLVA